MYRTSMWHNRVLLTTTMSTLSLTSAEASLFLRKKVMYPSTNDKSGFAEQSVSRFLKRSTSYFFTSIRTKAVKQYILSLNQLSKGAVGHTHTPPRSKRARLVFRPADAVKLLTGNFFITDPNSWRALLDALGAVVEMLGGGDKFFEPPAIPGSDDTVVCLLAQLTLVALKVREHLKAVAGVASSRKGMNPGHRGLWVQMLQEYHGKLPLSADVQNGLRLVDGASESRADVGEENEANPGNGLADFSSSDEGDSGGDGDTTDGDNDRGEDGEPLTVPAAE